ncbi:MAG: hypothetical protein KAH57_00480 [Thermoplasmata archaeon]|nr:hypothetical protein [Thermoplasmata archaeon]
MRYGDEDGYNSIYDVLGEPILHGNESVLVSEETVIPTLKTTWRLYGGEDLIEPSKGSIYLTNERMIFINAPERMMAIGGDHSRAMSSDMGSSFSLGEMGSDATVREYFEITNIEIMASEKKEGAVSVGDMVNVYILSSGNQFHLSFVLGADSGLLKRLMNKRVSSSDELVKNLKEFFKNTDWMYLPMEKDIYATEPTPAPAPIEKPTPPKKVTPRIAGRVQKKSTDQLHNKIESQSMKYFNNLYQKGLITEEIYSRLMEQYKGTSKGPVAPLMGTKAVEPPSQPSPQVQKPFVEKSPEPMPEPEPIPEAVPEPVHAPSNAPTSAEQRPPASGITTEPPPADPKESDDDLLGMLSDTLADMGDDLDESTDSSNPHRGVGSDIDESVNSSNLQESTPSDIDESIDSSYPRGSIHSDLDESTDSSNLPESPIEEGPPSVEDKVQPPPATAPRKIAKKVKQMTVRKG